MRIAVCVKQVNLPREGAALNPADRFALEEALRIRDAQGGEVTVVSMGADPAARVLRSCIALGADEGLLLSDKTFAGGDTMATATVLAQGLMEKIKPLLVICGSHSVDGETGQVGPALADKLDYPHTTHVSEILRLDEQCIRCRRITEDGEEIVELLLPALITVHHGMNQPRMATVKGILRANQSGIRRLNAADLKLMPGSCGLAGSPTRVTRTVQAVASMHNPFEVGGDDMEGQIEAVVALLLRQNQIDERKQPLHS
ncbi:electron transfer flavoprotein subunit beta/FixA family protein [Paenibacillus lutimineralis]|nr:electron transfer flavoprotein subunit beta/FixA family protein [Paenibacillus lutimineralis]